ncbi:scavenger mRNA decapping enzyme [Microthyrium microscopicum]|uniref:Scavenger mRNA decapping enzyme n=1 Tax=Microthyrium microscopicum TaxID=703497 RepID=A0A6A6UN81_9PEZI|nr:scavenger mRNA decapping enzyme [Microthyrium microscopicum]
MVETSDADRVAAFIPKFELQKVLFHDPGARRVVLLGTIDGQPGLVLVERTAFPSDAETLKNLTSTLAKLTTLSTNDIYAWFLGKSGADMPPDLKINLIYPCTDKHIAKYTPQRVRMVTETAAIYADKVRPYMAAQRDAGRLNWVFNILEGRKEQDDIIYKDADEVDGFLLMPDLNWDRRTLTGLHLLGIVVRRDIWSLRDLKHEHIPWLKHMREQLVLHTTKLYPDIEADELKLYVHYQPTYYHFHIHVVHCQLEAGATQAVGKAFGLENLVSQLEMLPKNKTLAELDLTYAIGENHDLWKQVFAPFKERRS